MPASDTLDDHVHADAQPRAQRADARRNRDALLAVAVPALARSDGEVTLEAIAREAGVGIGTLYRHFPTREALVEAASRHEVDQLCGAVGRLLATLPPEAALREWMQWFVDYVATKRGMAAALQPVLDSDEPQFAHTYDQIVSALRVLMGAAVDSGAIHPDSDPEDVLRALRGVWLVADEHHRSDQARRLLNLLMDGLRFGAPGTRGSGPSTG